MRRYTTIGLILGAALLANVTSASAQRWGRERTPNSGACFYENINYDGRYFCTPAGATTVEVPAGMNDRISSVRVFGNADVEVFQNPNFRGQGRVISNDVADLRRMGFNDRISSYRVDQNGRYYGNNRNNGNNGNRNDRYYPYDRRTEVGTGGVNSNNGRVNYRDAQAMVTRAFRSVLGRDPDEQGMRNWTQQVMQNNWTQRDLDNQMRQSQEYRETQGGRRR